MPRMALSCWLQYYPWHWMIRILFMKYHRLTNNRFLGRGSACMSPSIIDDLKHQVQGWHKLSVYHAHRRPPKMKCASLAMVPDIFTRVHTIRNIGKEAIGKKSWSLGHISSGARYRERVVHWCEDIVKSWAVEKPSLEAIFLFFLLEIPLFPDRLQLQSMALQLHDQNLHEAI